MGSTQLGDGVAVLAVDRTGRVAYIDADGVLHLGDGAADRGAPVDGAGDVTVASAAFAAGEDALVVVVVPLDDPDGIVGTVEHVDLESGERTTLAREGARPRWLP
jgi:hypothetical protein